MLRAVDAFCEPSASDLTVELRRQLLDRLGLFGLRFCISQIRTGLASSAGELARALVDESGLARLHDLISDVFLPRADILKARTALVILRTVARDLAATDAVLAAQLAGDIERCEASSPDFAELRLRHLVLSGTVGFSDAQREELEVVTARSGTVEDRLRGGPAADHAGLRARALEGIERWRTVGAAPMADVAMREACETMAHTYESLFVQLHEPRRFESLGST